MDPASSSLEAKLTGAENSTGTQTVDFIRVMKLCLSSFISISTGLAPLRCVSTVEKNKTRQLASVSYQLAELQSGIFQGCPDVFIDVFSTETVIELEAVSSSSPLVSSRMFDKPKLPRTASLT